MKKQNLMTKYQIFTNLTPSCNHMEKTDILYFEVEALDGINLIMFRDRSVTFSAKKVRFLVIDLLMLQNRGYSALNRLSNHRLHTKHAFSKKLNK